MILFSFNRSMVVERIKRQSVGVSSSWVGNRILLYLRDPPQLVGRDIDRRGKVVLPADGQMIHVPSCYAFPYLAK